MTQQGLLDKFIKFVTAVAAIVAAGGGIWTTVNTSSIKDEQLELREDMTTLAEKKVEVCESEKAAVIQRLEYAERFLLPPQVREGINMTYKGLERAILTRDRGSLASYFSENMLNRDKILAEWDGYLGKRVFFELQTLAKGAQDDQIIATVKGEILDEGGQTSWYFQDTLVKEAGQWKFIN